MYKSFIKILSILLILGLNWTGLSAVIETFAYFNDTEDSPQNVFSASTLDFSIPPAPDFPPEVTPTQNSFRDISVIKDGVLDFEYAFHTNNLDGGLCDNLTLDAYLDGSSMPICSGILNTFTCDVGIFSDPDDWQFTASLTNDDPSLENQICTFDFVFDGSQIGGAGFSDQEIISNTITSGQWTVPPPPAGLKINEVYYDVLKSQHCKEAKNEWVELYNPTNSPINLQKWEIYHGYGSDAICNPINANVNIPALGFAAVGHDNSTWVHCFPGVPSITIHQLGGPWPELGNDGDYIILKDSSGKIVDCVGWGNDPNTCNFPDGTVTNVAEGHSIARITAGVDTDTAADWQDLTTPNPGTNPHTTTIMVIPEIIEEDIEEESIIEETTTDEEIIGEDQTEEEIPSREDLIIPEGDSETSGETTEDVIEDTNSEIEDSAISEENAEESAIEENSDEVPAVEEQPATLPDENASNPDGAGESASDGGSGDGSGDTSGSLDSSSPTEGAGESSGDSGVDAGGESVSE